MRIFHPSKIAVGLAALFSVVVYGKDIVGMSTNQAFQVLTNVSSSSGEFVTAMKVLDHVSGETSFWLKIAEDKRYDADKRRRCVKHFFQHFVSAGMTLKEVEDIMGRNLDWVSYEHIQKVKRDGLWGWMPNGLLKGKSGFSIPILSDVPGDYHLVLLISFEEDLEPQDLLSELTGKVKGGMAGKAKIAACEAWDSDDQEKRYPGSRLHPWPWD